MSLGLIGALIGGVLTLLSPCSAMLLPAFFSYAFTSPTALIGRTFVFYLGLVTTLVPLGILAGTVGAFIGANRDIVIIIAAALVAVMGLLTAFNVNLPFMPSGAQASGRSSIAVYFLGLVYGVAGVCAGPILGAVLTIAAASTSALWGGIILLFFAAGMVLPLLALALVWNRIPAIQALVRPRALKIGPIVTTWTNMIGGLLMIGVGVLLAVTRGTANLSGVLSTSAQASIEGWVLRTSSFGTELVVLAAIAVLAVIVGVVLKRRRSRAEK